MLLTLGRVMIVGALSMTTTALSIVMTAVMTVVDRQSPKLKWLVLDR